MAVSKNSGYPKMDGFIREIPIKIDDLGIPLFLETPINNYHPHEPLQSQSKKKSDARHLHVNGWNPFSTWDLDPPSPHNLYETQMTCHPFEKKKQNMKTKQLNKKKQVIFQLYNTDIWIYVN